MWTLGRHTDTFNKTLFLKLLRPPYMSLPCLSVWAFKCGKLQPLFCGGQGTCVTTGCRTIVMGVSLLFCPVSVKTPDIVRCWRSSWWRYLWHSSLFCTLKRERPDLSSDSGFVKVWKAKWLLSEWDTKKGRESQRVNRGQWRWRAGEYPDEN